jgi:Mor family transcriptional regulator
MPHSEDRRYISRKQLIDLFGAEAATHVIQVFGGQRVYVPAPDSESYARVAARIGNDEIARKLCVEYGGTQILLPQRLAPINEQIRTLYRELCRPSEIARRLNCTENYVYSVLQKERCER